MFLSTRQTFVLLLLLGGIYYYLVPRLLYSSLAAADVDVILSSYREDISLVSEQISLLRNIFDEKGLSSKVIVYCKDESVSIDRVEPLRREMGADSVILLPNRGREGGTFLSHIISEYGISRGPHPHQSRHLLFAQSILEDPDLVRSRINSLRKDTAFISLGRYAVCHCGRDAHGQQRYFPRMREIYSMFSGELCPNTGQLCTYKGQFIVSREQIMKNTKRSYEHLLDIMQAPEGHWIYDDQHDREWEYRGQKSSPSSPFFGHALERSWPTIFNCSDPTISESCSLENPNACQCIH